MGDSLSVRGRFAPISLLDPNQTVPPGCRSFSTSILSEEKKNELHAMALFAPIRVGILKGITEVEMKAIV